jgi:hypothetical protein
MATTSPEQLSPALSAMATWESNWTSSLIKFVVLTVVFIITTALLFGFGNIKEIAENFPRYRCNPMIMPFSGAFGINVRENFDFCMTNMFNARAAEIFAPIYGLLGGFTSILTLVVDATQGLRKLFSNFFLGMNRFIRNVRDRIQNLLFQIRISFVRMNNLMGKVFGTMYSVVWMGLSGMTAGLNLADTTLFKFIGAFCFAPETPLRMADGSYKAIADVVIGDTLAPVPGNSTPVVTSTFLFDGSQTQMVRIGDVQISKNHYVIHNGLWMSAADHPDAVPSESIPRLICLNVSGHTFSIGKSELHVADYDEHSSPAVIKQAQRIAETALNGRKISAESPMESDYELGVDGAFLVRMADETLKRMDEIQIGDRVWNAGIVNGLVKEECDLVVLHNGMKFAESQLVNHKGVWARAAAIWTPVEQTSILYSLTTSNCGALEIRDDAGRSYFIRDYQEVPLAEMEEPYENAFRTKLKKE